MMGFSNLLQGDVLKFSILFFVIGTFFMLILKNVRKLFTKNKKKSIIYAIIVFIIFGLIGFLSSPKVFNDTAFNTYIAFQIIFLILGIVHVWVLRSYFSELSEKEDDFFSEFFFSLAFIFIGLIAFLKIVSIFKEDYKIIFLTATLPFIIPLILYKLYELALSIPVKIYKQWIYPVGENIKDPTNDELKNPLVISFEFIKKEDETNKVTNFRVKAPENLEFGKLFYFFLNDYNERHPEGTIDFLYKDNTPHKWVFYKKPSFFKGLKYINFNKTVIGNRLKENDIIICKRT